MKLSRPTKPTGSYSWLPTDVVRDSTLSVDARFILMWMMSHAPGYDFDREDIIEGTATGAYRVIHAMTELRERGLISTTRAGAGWQITLDFGLVGSQTDGQVIEGQTDVEDSGPLSGRLSGPQPLELSGSRTVQLSDVQTDRLVDVQTDLYVEKTTIKKQEPPIVPRRNDILSTFEVAWPHWPKRVEKKLSFERFERAVRIGKIGLTELAGEVIRFGDAYADTTETQFVPALAVWINRERWTDELPRLGPRRLTNAERNAALVMDLQRTEQLGIEA